MDLSHASDQDLINELQKIATTESELLGRSLVLLREVEKRNLHLSRGYPSLFVFCQGVLGYSEAQSYARIQAMRLTRAVPLAESKIQEGKLSLSVAALAQTHFRQVERAGKEVKPIEKAAIVLKLEGSTRRNAEQVLAQHLPVDAPRKEKVRAVSSELTRIEFYASAELMEKIGKLRSLLAHRNFEGRLDRLFEHIADIALSRLEKTALIITSDAPLLLPKQGKITRHVPAKIRRAVWARDKGRCQYRDPVTGKSCSTTHGVQLDHIVEFAKGGRHDPENLRLLCGAHNRWRSAAGPNATAPPSPRQST